MAVKEVIFSIASTKTNCFCKADIDEDDSDYIRIRNYSRVIDRFLFLQCLKNNIFRHFLNNRIRVSKVLNFLSWF